MEHSILVWSIRALAMAACSASVLLAAGAKTAAVRHRAWTATMLAMLLLPAWTVCGPSLNVPVLPSDETPSMPVPILRMPEASAKSAPASPSPAPPAFRIEPASAAWHPNGDSIFLALYLAGVAIMMVRLIRGTVLARRLRKSARAEGGFHVSSDCAAPVTVGWFQPVVLLPESWRTWPAARLNAVLIHEREHMRRRDALVQWLALLNRSIFWFHPLAWWLERKLAALAEEACDEAVLAQGHSPHDYAQHLLEMARSVTAHGMRIRRSGAAAFSAGTIQHRIRRIVEFRPPATSRARATAVATLCLTLLAVCLACNVASKQTAKQVRKPYASMAEQDRRDNTALRVRGDKWREEETLLQDAAMGLTPARAKLREAELKSNADQPYRARELVTYYQSTKDIRALNALTLWFIEHHPDIRQDWGTRPIWDTVWDLDGYEVARSAWLNQLDQPGHTANFYMNAGEYLSGLDNEHAEEIFLEGRRQFPDPGIHWEVFLARHYAWVLTGAKGQLSADRNGAGKNQSANTDPYANQIRRKLLASNDAELLDRTVEQLQINKPNAEFVKALIDRMFAIDPDSRQGHIRAQAMRRQSVLRQASIDLGSLNDSDRMLWLEFQLRFGRKATDPEAMANDLLAIAARNTKDPSYGAATLIAHLVLGEASLKRGDQASAVRHLEAAGSAPPDEYLRYGQINMTLPRQLVDAGEREAVAAFLDRCSRFGNFYRHLADFAAQIRKGENPRLLPNFDPFAKNPANTE